MATDGFVQVPTDSTGKKIDTDERINFAGQTVERQRVIIPDGVVVSGDALDRIWTEQRVQNLLLASAFGISDDLNMLGDLAANGFGGPLSQLVCPLLIGGVSSTSTLTLESTNGTGTTDAIFFKTGAQIERARIDTNGYVTIGGFANTSVPNSQPGQLEVVADPSAVRHFVGIGINANTNGPAITLGKTRGTSPASQVIVQNGDALASYRAFGSDGVAYQGAGSIACLVDGVPGPGSMPGVWEFYTTPSGSTTNLERLRIDSNGFITAGGVANQTGYATPNSIFQSNNTANLTSFIGLRWSNDNFGAVLELGHSPSGTIGTHSAVDPTTHPSLGHIYFTGSDGTAFQPAGQIKGLCDGTVSAGIVPGRIIIQTTNTSGTAVERLRIDSSGQVTIGGATANQSTADGASLLQVNGTTFNSSFATILSWRAAVGGAALGIGHSRGATVGTHTALSINDTAGNIIYYGDDGTALQETASITGVVDAAVSTGIVPGRLVFNTATTAGTITEGLRIDSSQIVSVRANTLQLVAGTASIAPLTFLSGTNLTTAAAGTCEFDGTSFYATSVASSRQVIDTEQVQVLSGGNTLAANTTAQALFNATANGAVTLAANTTYEFEMSFAFSGLSASAHTLSLGFGGTATFTSIAYISIGSQVGTLGSINSATSTTFQSVATAAAITASATNPAAYFYVRGTMRINASGTVIPQITQGTNGAAATVQTNSFFRCWPIGSGTVTNVGDWS